MSVKSKFVYFETTVTVNLGNYESKKITVGMSDTYEDGVDERKAAMEQLRDEVDEFMRTEIKRIAAKRR